MTGLRITTTLLLSLVAWSANAEILIYGPTLVGGTTADSSAFSTNFQTAVANEPQLLIPLTTRADGSLIDLSEPPCPTCLPYEDRPRGDLFSRSVSFRSPQAAEPARIILVGSTTDEPDDYRIGPMPNFRGALELDFEGPRNSLKALGLGLIGLAANDTITLYAANDLELLTYKVPSALNQYVFIGFAAAGGPARIGRAVIESDRAAYVLQDLTLVPEPSAGLAQAVSLLCIAGLAARRRRI